MTRLPLVSPAVDDILAMQRLDTEFTKMYDELLLSVSPEAVTQRLKLDVGCCLTDDLSVSDMRRINAVLRKWIQELERKGG